MPQKVAVVTGANRGIGFEVSRQLGALGFEVILTARNPEEGLRASSILKGQGLNVQFLQLDVEDPQSIQRAAKDVKKESIDVLVNNAGVLVNGDQSVITVSAKAVEKSFQTNTLGPLLVTQAFWPMLKASGGGRVINVSSGAGQLSEMDDWAPAYSISKTALNAVTRQLAAAGKLARIAVNSVCPGWVRTDMGTENAPRSVEEGAQTIVWLASEAPLEITGQFLRDKKQIEW